jgi:LysM repeat protein
MNLFIRLILIGQLIFITLNAFSFNDSIGVAIKNGNRYILHRVDKSQGLYAISKRYNVPVKDISKANGDSLDKLHVNQVIFIPIVSTIKQKIEIIHTVEKGETLYRISKKYNVSVDDVIAWNNLFNKTIQNGTKLKIIQEVGVYNKPKPKTEIVPKAEAYQNAYQATSPGAELIEIKEDGVATWFDNNTIGASKSLALHRDAPIGTIIKLTSVTNNKTVFVKVVGNLPKDDQKLKPIIEISKYSAKQLGLKDKFFLVKLAYFKKVEKPEEQ